MRYELEYKKLFKKIIRNICGVEIIFLPYCIKALDLISFIAYIPTHVRTKIEYNNKQFWIEIDFNWIWLTTL